MSIRAVRRQLDDDRVKVRILYGSQTGTGREVAERVGRELWRYHVPVVGVEGLDEYDKGQLNQEQVVIFVCSTTGEGEEPDNMKNFWKFLLRRNLPSDVLQSLKFAVFGLGDSSYTKFNFPAKKLYRRLLQLGAQPLCPRGDGDDQHYLGLDGAFLPWQEQLLEAIDTHYPMLNPLAPISAEVCPASNYHFEPTTTTSDSPVVPTGQPFRVIDNTRVTHPDHFQDTRSITLETVSSDTHLDFSPGDIASFIPRNLPAEVDTFLELMGWSDQADTIFRVVPSQNRRIPAPLVNPMSLRDIVTTYIDLRGIPRRTFVEYLRYFSKDELEKSKFADWLSSPEGQEDMFGYLHKPRRTLLEVLADFRSYQFPLDYLLDAFPAIQPRSFSIASAPGSSQLELLIGIVEYRTKLSTPRLGLTTQFIKHCLIPKSVPAPIVRVTLSRGTMRLPPSPNTPIIMVGPGLGVAPFRSFLQARVKAGATQNYLIFGCRYRDRDQYYAEEWDHYQKANQLWYRVASSRDQDHKLYVQDIIRDHGPLLWDLIHHQGAYIYVCGSAGSMPRSVLTAFQALVTLHHPTSDSNPPSPDPVTYFDALLQSGRYQQETWS